MNEIDQREKEKIEIMTKCEINETIDTCNVFNPSQSVFPTFVSDSKMLTKQ